MGSLTAGGWGAHVHVHMGDKGGCGDPPITGYVMHEH